MTVIAGVSLFNGVMLLSDCRVTVKSRGRPDVHCDVAQKIFPLTDTTVIGFAGDVSTASFILASALKQIKGRMRKDSISLLQWLPRFLRAAYNAFERKSHAGEVYFIVGSIMPDRPNIIERQKVAELMNTIALGSPSMQRNWIPEILVRVLQTPSSFQFVVIPGTVRGILYTMTFPNFEPKHLSPLEYCAIGSGQKTAHEIARNADWILSGLPGNDMVESMALRDAVSQFVVSNDLDDVGGMYPCVKIDKRGVGCLGLNQKLPLYDLALSYDQLRMRWVQENRTIGKKIELLYPWEIKASATSNNGRFDDWRDAIVHFNPRRGRKMTQKPERGTDVS